jgi:magnesium chelatase subunit I
MGRRIYPFTAIIGQELMKQALLLNAINPAVGGVLIRGDRGTAKSTAVRALAALLAHQDVVEGCRFGCDPLEVEAHCEECRERLSSGGTLPVTQRQMRVVELPVNASEDRVVGTIDLEAALTQGMKRFEPGLLASAHRNILYVDEVNLLDDHIIDVLLDAAATGVNVVEREGLSVMHPARFILVGTMNPEEGELRPQLLDRFGLCVQVSGVRDLDARVQIAELRSRWDADPTAVAVEFDAEQAHLRNSVAEAMARCGSVEIPRSIRRMIANLSIILEVDGHRPDLVLARAAQATAALAGADVVDATHLGSAAEMVYLHRRPPSSEPQPAISAMVSRVVIAEARRPAGRTSAVGMPSTRTIRT